jgi:hypothetical protein
VVNGKRRRLADEICSNGRRTRVRGSRLQRETTGDVYAPASPRVGEWEASEGPSKLCRFRSRKLCDPRFRGYAHERRCRRSAAPLLDPPIPSVYTLGYLNFAAPRLELCPRANPENPGEPEEPRGTPRNPEELRGNSEEPEELHMNRKFLPEVRTVDRNAVSRPREEVRCFSTPGSRRRVLRGLRRCRTGGEGSRHGAARPASSPRRRRWSWLRTEHRSGRRKSSRRR